MMAAEQDAWSVLPDTIRTLDLADIRSALPGIREVGLTGTLSELSETLIRACDEDPEHANECRRLRAECSDAQIDAAAAAAVAGTVCAIVAYWERILGCHAIPKCAAALSAAKAACAAAMLTAGLLAAVAAATCRRARDYCGAG